MNLLQETLARLAPPDALWSVRAAARQQHLTKPPLSLGRLEEVANRVVGIQQSLTPQIDPARIVVFAADHGVAAEGVSPYPREVTAQMVLNFWPAAPRSIRCAGPTKSNCASWTAEWPWSCPTRKGSPTGASGPAPATSCANRR